MKKRIVILGAGASGLGAARWLTDNDIENRLDIIVLESRDRIGGRVNTSHEFGIPIDLGASWLHSHCPKNPLTIMSKHMHLHLKETDFESDIMYDAQGNRLNDKLIVNAWNIVEKSLYDSGVLALEHPSTDSIEHTMQNLIGQDKWSNPLVQVWMSEFDFDLGAPLYKISPAAIDRDWIRAIDQDDDDCDMMFVNTGFIAVLEGLVSGEATNHRRMKSTVSNKNGLRSLNIMLNHRVCNVTDNQRMQSNTQEFGAAYSVTTCVDGVHMETIEADIVLVTLPLGVLKANSVTFDPPLSISKQSAISTAGFGNVVKVVMEFDKVFWPSNTEFISIADAEFCTAFGHGLDGNETECGYQKRGMMTYFWNLFAATGRKILVGFGLGDGATILDKVRYGSLYNTIFCYNC